MPTPTTPTVSNLPKLAAKLGTNTVSSTTFTSDSDVDILFGTESEVKTFLDPKLDALFNLFRPTTLSQFVEKLDEPTVRFIVKKFPQQSCNIPEDCENQGELRSALLTLLNKYADGLKSYLSRFVDKAGEWTPTSIHDLINPVTGLNLLLANPVVAAVVMQKRKRDFEMARARVLPAASGFSGFPGGLNPSVLVQLHQQRGGYEGGENLPVEMRGGGRLLAAMKGGNFFLGTMGSPTSWRPITDSSFISVSLEAAYQNLKANLKASKGADLAQDTQDNVKKLITALKAAEDAVKEKRDELNKFNTILSTQNLKDIKNTSVTEKEITDMVKLYNDSMSRRQSLENKMFRVIVALGNQMQTVTV
jgi:hypothetical protein